MAVARRLDLDELVDHFTLNPEELALLRNKTGATRLGFALLLKYLAWKGRFPRSRSELPDNAIEHVARQVRVPPEELGFYDWAGRTVKAHRAEARRHLGFRECTVGDTDKLIGWLTEHVAQRERRAERVREQLLAHCSAERIEPPTSRQVDRMVASALHQAEQALCWRISARLPAATIAKLALVTVDDSDGEEGPTLLAMIKAEAGEVSLDTMLTEITKLEAVRAVGLPPGLFDDVAPKVVTGCRLRAAVESPSHLRTHPEPLRVTLLAALLHARERELTDTLTELLISTVHRIGARAERKVTKQLTEEFRRVTGKEAMFARAAEAMLNQPDGTVRQVVFPVVDERTLRDVVAEFKRSGPTYRRIVQTTLRASYTNHYRKGLIRLLEVFTFRSTNTAHQPVVEALGLIGRYAHAGNITYYPLGERIPVHSGMTGDWAELVYRADTRGRQRVVRAVYEICTFEALRERLRCKEMWVVGADRWRNPDQDLPADFEERREEHYAALRKPLDPSVFIDDLQREVRAELAALNDALPGLEWVDIAERRAGAIRLTPLEAAPEPRNLRRLKQEIRRRWGTVPLIDVLKEAALRTGCLNAVTAVTGRGDLPADVLAQRLLLAVYAYGTNTGIRTVAAGGHGHTEEEIRYVRRRYLTPEIAREMGIKIANATFAARQQAIWGEGSTAVASDSTHMGAFDQNLLTEWHSRYRGRGVLIYWHLERRAMAIHSQLISCTASEVAAMVEGAMHHGTAMQVEGNYTDSHGQSEIGFGITRLLGFDLLPRIKRINKVKLYRPAAGEPDAYPRLAPALTRPIRWSLIAENYDAMIRYATAIRVGTATTEAILRRFTRTATHPTYAAMLEVGRAQKTTFVARYLRDRELQREIGAGLNVAENHHGAGKVICYGNGGELATNHRDEQELVVACLRVLQAALVYVNTLMLQDVLADDGWEQTLTPADRRGLTPLFWTHVAPYGEVRLNMHHRLSLRGPDRQPDQA